MLQEPQSQLHEVQKHRFKLPAAFSEPEEPLQNWKPLHTNKRLPDLLVFFCVGCSQCAIAMNHAGYGFSILCWIPSRSSFMSLKPLDINRSDHQNRWCYHCGHTDIPPAYFAIKIRSVQHQIQINRQHRCVLNQTGHMVTRLAQACRTACISDFCLCWIQRTDSSCSGVTPARTKVVLQKYFKTN